MSSPAAPHEIPTVRAIMRVVVTVVLSVLALYLVYLLREPLSWLLIAMFVTVAASGPVNILSRRLPRGAAIAIVYQQFENYVGQPRIQSRAVQLDPFIVVIAAIFGGTLLGVIGALLAIPSAAAIQIAIREYMEYRRTYPAASG